MRFLPLLLLTACGTAETAAVDLETRLMLCSDDGCEDPGQLILMSGMGDTEHNPLHYAAVDQEQAQGFIESGLLEDVVFAAYTEVEDIFDIRCDHLGPNLFGCARAGEAEFDNGLRLQVCEGNVCTSVPQLVLLSGQDLDHTPFSWRAWDADRWLNDAGAGADLRAQYPDATRHKVICQTAIEGHNPMTCTQEPL